MLADSTRMVELGTNEREWREHTESEMPKMQGRESETHRKLAYCHRHPQSYSATHTDVGLYGTNLSAQMADRVFKLIPSL